MTRFLAGLGRFFGSWGFLKFVLVVVALVILVYVEEDWRGARAWAATKAKWEAQGETFDPAKIIPPPVPDEQNLAALPIFELTLDPNRGSPAKLIEALDEEKHGGPLPQNNQSREEICTKLATAYKHAFPDKAVPTDPLIQFETLYPLIPEIRRAATVRPSCRFNQDYSVLAMSRGLQLLTEQIKLGKWFALDAVIAMGENQPEIALQDLRLNFRLAAAVGRDPTLVAGLVDIGITAINLGVIDKLLREHRFTDAELVEIQDQLGRIDMLSQYEFTMRGEVVTATLPMFEYIKANARKHATALNEDMLYGSLPAGWLDLDKAHTVDYLLRELECVDPQARRVHSELHRKLAAQIEYTQELPWRLEPWNLFFEISVGPITRCTQQFSAIAVHLDEDRIVCALERYRLTHGIYPAKLEALVPAFIDQLPHDIMGGDAYHYQLRADGTFLLYSVGWNQADDEGRIVFETDTPTHINYEEGDWVWPMTKQTPAK